MSNWLTPIARTFDNAVANELFTALTTVSEGKRVAAGLTALAERHANNTRTDVVHINPWTITLIISSKGGCWSGREVELQVPLTADESDSCRSGRRAPTLWVSGSDTDLHRYIVPETLAYWAARKAAVKIGELRACQEGLVPSYDISGYLESDSRHMPADSGLFLGLGLYSLAEQIDQATQPQARFTPAPEDEPLVLRRKSPWSPADHEVPAGRIVEDILDVPANGTFTAVFDAVDGVGRGVTPLMGFTHETTGSAPVIIRPSGWYSPLKNEWAHSALRADRYVIHEDAGETLRELGAKVHMSTLDIPAGAVGAGDDVEPAEGPAYIGPLPGNPHRRIRWDDGVTIVLTTQGEDGKWTDIDSVHVSDTAEDGAVEQAEDALLEKHNLCWADLDNARDTEPEDQADAGGAAPTKYFNEEGEEIPEWEIQLTGLTGEETVE